MAIDIAPGPSSLSAWPPDLHPGGMVAVAGVAAVVVLVADADATLFLYTGRLVVGVIGLIVLVPTLALVVIGRELSIIGSHIDGSGPSGRDPIEKSGGRQ